MDGSVILQHVLASLIPWLVGSAVGGCLGYACALAARAVVARRHGFQSLSLLLPWRTIVVALVLVSFSPFVPVLVGLGTTAGATMVALLMLLFAVPLAAGVLWRLWFPPSLSVQMIGGSRTLATGAVTAAAFTPAIAGGGGAGVLVFREGWLVANYPQALKGFVIVVLLALIVDILLGTLQYLLARRSKKPRRSRICLVNHATPLPPYRG